MTLSLRWTFPAAALLSLAACTGGSPQPQPPTASVNVPPGDSAQAGGSSTAGPSAAPNGAPSAKADAPPQTTITNEPPPGGTVTSNASPSGGSDRMKPMMDLIGANRDGFRKCFDQWAKKNPGQGGKVAFQFFLKVDGTLEKAQMKPDEGDLHAPEVENCMINFAKTLTYPKSTTGKETTYTHRFEFKALPK